ncbi:MAG: 4-amino-4-deoxychorismate lyase [Candidatus Dadabacteria bacterium]|nr:MAG: 4-amino-4-deoxychorismate lyase [Candidatus Dadabacteria bacterium]
MTRYAWLNGRLVDEAAAVVPAADRGFLYADGLFETLRLYGGRPFRLADHWARLTASSRFLGLPDPPDPNPAIEALVRANGAADAVVRFTWTRGARPAGPRPGPAPNPTFLATLRPLPPDLARRRAEGVEARTVSQSLRARGLAMQGHKTLAYLGSVWALGRVPGGAEPLLLTTEGHLAEGATSNLFWVRDGVCHTPHPDTGCLPGIAARVARERAAALGLEVREGFYEPGHLAQADEAFLTNSVVEIVPLVALDGRAVGAGRPGAVTRRLQEAYAEAVRREGGAP